MTTYTYHELISLPDDSLRAHIREAVADHEPGDEYDWYYGRVSDVARHRDMYAWFLACHSHYPDLP